MSIITAASFTLFLAICMIIFLLYSRWQENSITRRLKAQQGIRPGLLLRLYRKLNEPIKANLRRSGIGVKITPETMLIIIAVCICLGFFIGLLLNNIAVSLMLAVTGFFAPRYWLKTQVAKQQNMISEKASIVIHVLITSFQFGVNVQSFKTAVEQMPSPIRAQFEKVIAQLLAGKEDILVLSDFEEKVENRYLRFALKNILISLRKGTDVTKILFNLMESVSQEKIRIAKIKKASSEASFMATVSLGIMGVIIIGYSFLSPQFLEAYITTFAGKLAVAMLTGVVLFCLSTFEKIKHIEV